MNNAALTTARLWNSKPPARNRKSSDRPVLKSIDAMLLPLGETYSLELPVRTFEMLSSEELGVKRPGAGANHCQGRAKRR